MKPRFLLPLLAVVFATTSAFAGRYGSETVFTLNGTTHQPGTQTDKKLKGGDVQKTTAYKTGNINNQTVLSALKKRGLIATTAGYSIVMVGQTHTADGIKFFAIASGKNPVAIPTDILNLSLSDGPRSGTLVVDKNGTLKTLASETRNFATLTVAGFSGSGIVTQSWTSKPIVKNGVSEVVELMDSKGKINGVVSTSGIGVIDLGLTKSKVVDLQRYGMATSTSTGSFGGSVTVGTPPSEPLSPIGTTPYLTTPPNDSPSSAAGSTTLAGTLVLNGSSTYTGSSVSLSPGGILWVNPSTTTATDIGLTLAFDGTVLPLSPYSISQPNELTITTADGPLVFTRESGTLWTPVVPAAPAPETTTQSVTQ